MKFKSVLTSDHDLKKNGYKVIRKLYKMRKRKGAEIAYNAPYEDTYFFVLSIRSLAEIIEAEKYGDYSYAVKFRKKCDHFLSYLDERAKGKMKLNKKVTAGFLRSYTKFFNNVLKSDHLFLFDQHVAELWNSKCLIAYLATWDTNR